MTSYPNRETSWHDNLIYALHIEAPEPDRGLLHSNLILDIDHIVEWVRDAGDGVKFRVAPATLTFHDVTDLCLAIDFRGDHRQSLNELSISSIDREEVETKGLEAYFNWVIELNLPSGGRITFGSSGYTQDLRAAPVLCDEQYLSASQRPNLILGGLSPR